ncbi:hypothetical protein PF005_g6115 [Phytophthora fragariae]|uniref:Uncharacterized protein n=2 Tax=Phytophthora fragariae TaxID=53985 RepID=A0A6A3SZ10_9STRA|nr:hypothetical protein PF009_g5902 [Phytophthora fragariae]KAE9124081.1 hypothetical protein PF007_g6837 [Phytophthora fragariae]KAE9223925.1 hypothetical protein PF005_g6115 [Phytophthora fragariae]
MGGRDPRANAKSPASESSVTTTSYCSSFAKTPIAEQKQRRRGDEKNAMSDAQRKSESERSERRFAAMKLRLSKPDVSKTRRTPKDTSKLQKRRRKQLKPTVEKKRPSAADSFKLVSSKTVPKLGNATSK